MGRAGVGAGAPGGDRRSGRMEAATASPRRAVAVGRGGAAQCAATCADYARGRRSLPRGVPAVHGPVDERVVAVSGGPEIITKIDTTAAP